MLERLEHIDFRLLVITLICLLLYNFIGDFEIYNSIYFGAFFILILGIPHGAIDHIIFFKVSNSGKSSWSRFILLYVSCSILYGIVWYFSPMIALGIFVLVSAYHFGEGQLHYISVKKSWIRSIFFLSYGMTVLASFFYYHTDFCVSILDQLNTDIAIYWVRITRSLYHLFLALLFFKLLVLVLDRHIKLVEFLNEILVVIVIHIVFLTLPPLLAFSFYFCVWHSIKVLSHQYNLLKEIDNVVIIPFVKKLLPYTTIAVFGIVLAVLLSNVGLISWNPLLSFFVMISLITLPHAYVMSMMYLFRNN